MKNKIIKILFIIIICLISTTLFAQDTSTTLKAVTDVEFKSGSYELISPIGNLTKVADQSPGGFSEFVNLLITIAIALAGAIAVIMIIIAGIQYMGTGSVWEKGESKTKATAAIGGLILLLCSYIILNTINPDLVNIRIGGFSKIDEGKWDVPDEPEGNSSITIKSGQFPASVSCPGKGKESSIKSIAQSFEGKVTYAVGKEGGKGEPGPKGTILLDCSGFVTTVLKCAGFKPGTDFTDGGTSNLFDAKSEVITTAKENIVNNKVLRSGDIVGYVASDIKGKKYGHVLIFTGTSFIQSRGGIAGRTPGGNSIEKIVTAEELFKHGSIKRIRRIP